VRSKLRLKFDETAYRVEEIDAGITMLELQEVEIQKGLYTRLPRLVQTIEHPNWQHVNNTIRTTEETFNNRIRWVISLAPLVQPVTCDKTFEDGTLTYAKLDLSGTKTGSSLQATATILHGIWGNQTTWNTASKSCAIIPPVDNPSIARMKIHMTSNDHVVTASQHVDAPPIFIGLTDNPDPNSMNKFIGLDIRVADNTSDTIISSVVIRLRDPSGSQFDDIPPFPLDATYTVEFQHLQSGGWNATLTLPNGQQGSASINEDIQPLYIVLMTSESLIDRPDSHRVTTQVGIDWSS